MKIKQPDSNQRGFTLIELAIVVIVLGILMSLAVAALFRARMSANEGRAVASLRTINTAQFQYQSACGNGLYAQSLLVLGTKPAGETQAFLGTDLGLDATPTLSGYTFTLGPGTGAAASTPDCNGTPTISSYYATAAPAEPDEGTRAFATNHLGTLWQAVTGTPPAEPFGPPSTIVE